MRAAMINEPYSMTVIDVPEPVITRPDQVKIQVTTTGICGSELHAYHGTHPFRIPPIISGHEFAGRVVEIGKDVTTCKTGDRVTIEPHYGCGTCKSCRNGDYNVCKDKKVLGAGEWTGSFGEFIVVPQQTVLLLPDNLNDEVSSLIEPISVAMHAVRKAELSIGDRICVIGCGPIGLSIILCARLAGAEKIIVSDALEANLELARQMGATHCINPVKQNLQSEIGTILNSEGTDITFLAFANQQVFDDALHITRPKGKISQIALVGGSVNINIGLVQQKELKLIGSNMYTMKDFECVRDALSDGRLKNASKMISEVGTIENAPELIQVIDQKLRPVIKVLMKF